MVRPFEEFNVDVSCLGNHELDNGMDTAVKLLGQTTCPWLMTNLVEKDSGKPIANCQSTHVLET